MSKCLRSHAFYDDVHSYDRDGDGWIINRILVGQTINRMLACFPNCGPHFAECYAWQMVEEIMVKRSRACTLESTCRRILRTKKFPPTIAEMLEVIDDESARWRDRLDALDEELTFDDLAKETEGLIAEAKKLLEPVRVCRLRA